MGLYDQALALQWIKVWRPGDMGLYDQALALQWIKVWRPGDMGLYDQALALQWIMVRRSQVTEACMIRPWLYSGSW